MKKFSEEIRRFGGALTLCAAGMILLGILLIVFPDTLLLAFCYIAGGLALAFGLGKLIAYFVRQKNEFVFTFDVGISVASLVVGLLLLICPFRVASLFPTVMGVLLIVDGVFNHTGRGFFAFQDLLKNRESSPFRDWYCNVNFWGNNEYNDHFSYDNWGGFNLLVKLNLWNPVVRDYHFDTIRFWVSEFDIDGIRLDAADVLEHEFMRQLRGVCDSLKPEFWLMGEVIHGDYSRWANGQMLHSVTNYELHKGLYSGHNDHNYFEIAHSVRRLLGICGNVKLYTFVDNHDVARIMSKLNNKEHIYNVMMLDYTLPGIPSLYYGSEFGIEAQKEWGSDWNLRPCLELADFADATESNPVTVLIAQLGKIHADYPELSLGEYKELTLTTRQYSFARIYNGKAVITALNNDDVSAELRIPLPVNAQEAAPLLTGMGEVSYRMENGNLVVELPPNRGMIFSLA